ncbi:MAG: hypothetical protein KC535_04840 [Nanoarchaeota archaeon]|nr:hypothetical protein [Nanoarchaeota archaeon]
MNLKNKYLVITLRVLFSLFLIFSGVSGLLAGPSAGTVPEPMRAITQMLWTIGIFPLAKVMEVIVGVLLLINRYPAFATVAFVPLSVGILVFNASISPAYLPTALLVAALNAYFIFVYWKAIRPLLAKTIAIKNK